MDALVILFHPTMRNFMVYNRSLTGTVSFLEILVLLFAVSAHLAVLANDHANIRYLPTNSAAKCIDGSVPAYYVHKGSGSGATKWLIYFQGGAWCFDLKQCFLRSKTDLGSSKRFSTTQLLHDYFSSDENVNPMMHNWNIVYIRYCDGGSFAGNADHDFQV